MSTVIEKENENKAGVPSHSFVWKSSCPSIIYGKDSSFPTRLSWNHCFCARSSVPWNYVSILPRPPPCTGSCTCVQVLKSVNVSPPFGELCSPFLFWLFWVPRISIQILGFVCQFVQMGKLRF